MQLMQIFRKYYYEHVSFIFIVNYMKTYFRRSNWYYIKHFLELLLITRFVELFIIFRTK